MSGTLAGLRVLDLSRLLPGPFCSLLLSDFGADVIKVEDTGMGDYLRWWEPMADEGRSAMFGALNRGKRSVALDLKQPEGAEAFRRLAATADVVLESFRPGVMDRLGVGYETLERDNPGLVYCAITGYGQDGPYRDRPGHDLNYLGLTGLLDLSGEADGPPVQAAGQIADIGGGALMAAFGILAALRERDRSGQGQFVDVSMTDGALSWLAMVAGRYLSDGTEPRRGDELLGGGYVCYRPYACADGHVTLGALEPKFFRAFCEGVGREDLIAHQFDRTGGAAHRELEQIFAQRTRAGWQAFASEHDCCLEPVLTVAEALESELVRARGMVIGAQLAPPVKFSRTPADPQPDPGPRLGEHTDEVLREIGSTA